MGDHVRLVVRGSILVRDAIARNRLCPISRICFSEKKGYV